MAKEKVAHFNLRIPAKLKKQMEKDASNEKRSLNQHIVYAIETLVNQRSSKPAAESN